MNEALTKMASERIRKLASEKKALKEENVALVRERDEYREKLASLEREKKVDHILDVMIDEKHYFLPSQRIEKKAMLMNPKVDLDAFIATVSDLSPKDNSMLVQSTTAKTAAANKEEQYLDDLIEQLTIK